jgi:hypothetical protein
MIAVVDRFLFYKITNTTQNKKARGRRGREAGGGAQKIEGGGGLGWVVGGGAKQSKRAALEQSKGLLC